MAMRMYDDRIIEPPHSFTFVITVEGNEADEVASALGHVLDAHVLPDIAGDHDGVRIGLDAESADASLGTWSETCTPPIEESVGRTDN